MQDTRLNSATRQYAMSGASLVTFLLLVDSLTFRLCQGFAPHLDPSVSTMYIMGIATIEIGLFGLWHRRLDLKALRHHFWFFVVIGLLIGVSTLLTYTSVNYSTPEQRRCSEKRQSYSVCYLASSGCENALASCKSQAH